MNEPGGQHSSVPAGRRAIARVSLSLGAALVALGVVAAPARAQIGTLVSPGPLARAHASLEGAANCEKCHEPGRRVTAERCLACHRPVAERIKAGKGVHKGVTECAKCHAEHAGRDGDLLHFTTRGFDHAAVAGFALEGRHAGLKCADCHKTRSYLTVQPACVTCHADPHKGRFGLDCARCHSVNVPFKQVAGNFDHNLTAYPLVGAHRTVPCAKCHVNQVYRGLKFQLCTDCHKTPHRQPLGDSCTSCHTPETWRTQKIDHARTGYPLLGKHAAVACAACHVKPAILVRLKYDRCAACHSDPHKGVFKQDCGACHQVTGFGKTPFDHNTTRFPLTGRHVGVECRACHKNLPAVPAAPAARPPAGQPLGAFDFRGLSTDCVSCHVDVHRGDAGPKCEGCHSTAAFRPVTYTHPRQPEFFAGQHAGVGCEKCHRPGPAPAAPRAKDAPLEGWRFKNVSTACATCHADPHLGQVGTACESCHSIDAAKFAVVKFTHAKTAFPLTGKHQTVKCEQCHKRETAVFPAGQGTAVRLKGMSLACRSCHTDPHLGQVGIACEGCHDTTTFHLATYQHKPPVMKLMVGSHAKLVCADCHKKVQGTFPAGSGIAVRYTGIGTLCSSCHEDVHRGAFGTTCESCHSPKAAWREASRGFHQATNFPLVGRHQAVGCAQCHWNGVTKGTPTACYDCHWVRRQDDRYFTRLGSQCQDCHRPISWTAVSWDHGAATGMPLSGVHRALGCEACHKDRQFVSLGRTCYSCHAADYNSTTNPNHAAAGFPITCDTCHNASASNWNTSFAHNAFFPLVGVHATLACNNNLCHGANNNYTTVPTTCVGCHQADYNSTNNPPHAAAGFPTACDSCHHASDPNWTSATFNHSTFFPLVGLHATLACNNSLCHGANNNYTTVPTTCVGCHLADYNATNNPPTPRPGSRPPVTRATMRRTRTGRRPPSTTARSSRWSGSTRRWPAATAVPRGQQQLHDGADHLRRLPPRGLQRDDRPESRRGRVLDDVRHVPPGVGDELDGQLQSQPVLRAGGGARDDGLQQQLVPRNNNYTTVPTTCVGCHLADYNGTTNPNHAAAGFPTDCTQCHKATDASWTLGVFNHTQFPIASGRHSGFPCSACHQNATNFAIFQCTTSCHPQASVTANHSGVSGFVYTSAACYSCHPNGSAGIPAPVPRLAVSHTRAPVRAPDRVMARNEAGGALPALRCVASHARALQ